MIFEKLKKNMVRTRFAPSPTGYMHVGNLRTALYAYLFAKSNGGKFILRIEDTDSERRVEGTVDVIFKTLKETGLFWDEGPDIGGIYGPYVQSERMKIYKEHALSLVDKGHAYYCFCDKGRLDEIRKGQEKLKIPPKYDGFCKNISNHDIEKKLDSGLKYVIRQKIPAEGYTSFEDEVFGKITIENSTLDESILMKSDGMPTYNFANVIDDHLMQISHVIRGNEYLSSTPKYILLYEAFGWKTPTYIHVAPIIKENGKKLSKRDGDASYEDLIKKGYLKEAIINFIALLGWSSKTEKEVFSLEELEKVFDVTGIGKSPSVFDEKKLLWLNAEYIKYMKFEVFHEKASVFYQKIIKNKSVDTKKISKLLHTRLEKFTQIPDEIDFFDEPLEYKVSLFTHKKMKTDSLVSFNSLNQTLKILNNLISWDYESLKSVLMNLAKNINAKNSIILWPLRVSITGKEFTPGGAVEISEILGKEETIKRIKMGIEKLRQDL